MALKELIVWHKIYKNVIDILSIYEKYPHYEDFVNKKRVVNVVLSKLKKIGNLSESIPKDERVLCKNVAWDKILMLKKIDSGDAFGPDLSITWEIITHHLFNFAKKISPRITKKYQTNLEYKKKMARLDKILFLLAKKISKKK